MKNRVTLYPSDDVAYYIRKYIDLWLIYCIWISSSYLRCVII